MRAPSSDHYGGGEYSEKAKSGKANRCIADGSLRYGDDQYTSVSCRLWELADLCDRYSLLQRCGMRFLVAYLADALSGEKIQEKLH